MYIYMYISGGNASLLYGIASAEGRVTLIWYHIRMDTHVLEDVSSPYIGGKLLQTSVDIRD